MDGFLAIPLAWSRTPCYPGVSPIFPGASSGTSCLAFDRPRPPPWPLLLPLPYTGLAKHFRGHISELLRHPAGTHAVDDLWAVADTKLRNSMASEFYGRCVGQGVVGDGAAGSA